MMPTTLLIRADATTLIGIGHIMRCLALAQAWRDRGGRITFLSNCESDAQRRRIIDEGFNFIPIENSHPDPLDLSVTLENLSAVKNKPLVNQWLIIDGYHFTTDYQKEIKDSGYHLLVIDDYNHLPYYHADILLNQNINAQNFKYSCDDNTTQLLGCKYTLLRREFLKYKGLKREIPEKANKILVTLGGADPENVTLKVIEAIKQLDDPVLDVKVAVGPANPNLKILKKAIHQAPCSIQLLQEVDMPDLMQWSDIAISAGGSTCWELAFMGVPFLIVVMAQNQEAIAIGLDNAKAAFSCGWFYELSSSNISKQLEKPIEDKKKRKRYSEKGRELVDGLGAERIIGSMRNY